MLSLQQRYRLLVTHKLAHMRSDPHCKHRMLRVMQDISAKRYAHPVLQQALLLVDCDSDTERSHSDSSLHALRDRVTE
jgi:hypothetical protein